MSLDWVRTVHVGLRVTRSTHWVYSVLLKETTWALIGFELYMMDYESLALLTEYIVSYSRKQHEPWLDSNCTWWITSHSLYSLQHVANIRLRLQFVFHRPVQMLDFLQFVFHRPVQMLDFLYCIYIQFFTMLYKYNSAIKVQNHFKIVNAFWTGKLF